MRLQTKLWVLLVVAVLLGLTGCGASHKTAATSTSPVAGSSQGGSRSLFGLAGAIEPLHDPSVTGVSLDDALAQIGRPLALPSAASSDLVKVLFDKNEQGFQLSILYSSGIELAVVTGSADLAGWVTREASGKGPKYDDHKQHSKLASVAGKEVLTIAGGMQASGTWHAPTVVSWNQDGCVYTLFDRSADVSTEATDAAISNMLNLVAATK